MNQRESGGGSAPSLCLFLIGGVDDVHKLLGLQGGTADEAAVDVRLGQQLSGVLGIHAAAVLNGDAAGHPCAVQAADGGADVGAHFACLLCRGGFAGTDGPDGFVGDDAAAQFLCAKQACYIQGGNRKRVKLEYADCVSKCE